jgi:UMP-CMP kinase
MTAKPKVVFVLGGPGAGKGTQCKLISDEFDFVHLSAGDLLREERQRPGSEYGELIESYIRDGKIVPVQITCSLLKRAMENHGWENGKFLIDGFPRNMDNLQGWKDATEGLVEEKFCLFFDCPEAVMEERVLARGATSGRSDDNVESIRKRFKTFIESTMPIVESFREQGKVRVVKTDRSVELVWEDIRPLFKEIS